MTKSYLKTVYTIGDADARRRYYDEWAASYDAEVSENGYVTPARCAQALIKAGLPSDAQVLDVGCGTGLAGQALAAAGFAHVDGTDVSQGMLDQARRRGVYRNLWLGDPDHPPRIPPVYDAIAAVGVIGTGAAPASLLGQCIDALRPGGLMVFSFNDHALDDPQYPAALQAVQDDGRARLLDKQHGPHLPAMGMNAWVYTLRRP